MNFGVPKQSRTTKVEKYPELAVVTLLALEGEKKTRRIVFNAKAEELMGLPEGDATIAFSFDDGIGIVNASGTAIPDEHKLRVTKAKPRKVSDKRTYEYIIKQNELTDGVDNEFTLEITHVDGLDVFKLHVKPIDESGSDEIIGEDMKEEVLETVGEAIPFPDSLDGSAFKN